MLDGTAKTHPIDDVRLFMPVMQAVDLIRTMDDAQVVENLRTLQDLHALSVILMAAIHEKRGVRMALPYMTTEGEIWPALPPLNTIHQASMPSAA